MYGHRFLSAGLSLATIVASMTPYRRCQEELVSFRKRSRGRYRGTRPRSNVGRTGKLYLLKGVRP